MERFAAEASDGRKVVHNEAVPRGRDELAT